MTIEELRDFLNELIETNPDCKDKEVKVQRWGKDGLWNEDTLFYDSVLDVAYLTDKEILTIEGEW